MTESRTIFVRYCDDVRQEVGNKYSLMGCYGSEMFINKLPAVLPKLCAQVQINTPPDRPFAELTIRAELNNETISELQLTTEQLSEPKKNLGIDGDSSAITIIMIMAFSPLVVSEPCKLQILAETEEGPLRGNTLRLKEANS